MSFASAFGFSGYDPIGSFFEGSMNSHFDRKAENRAYLLQQKLLEKQYEYVQRQMADQFSYAQRYSENTPSWNVKGLRAAGLNPILAVGSGSFGGVSIPSVPAVSTPSAPSHRSPSNSKFSFNASGLLPFDRSISKQNADAQTTIADANLLKAKSDAALRQAQTAEVIQRTGFERNRLGQKRYNSPAVRDVMGLVDELSESTKGLLNDVKGFLMTEPLRSDGTSLRNLPVGKSTQTRHSDYREKDSNRKIDSQWKSSKKIDGKPVYRKRGDIGGVMHMYR